MISFFKLKTFFLLIAVASFSVIGQTTDATLATATGIKFTSADLSPETKTIYERTNEIVANNRKKFFEQTVSETLLETEAKLTGTTVEKILDAEIAKLPQPADAKIKEVYDVNREALGGRTLEQTRKQIVGFLMKDQIEKAEADLIASLKTKHKYTAGKDINAVGLKPADIVFTSAGKPFTAREFDEKNRIALNDVSVHVYEEILAGLEDAILNKLIAAEAATRNIDTPAFVAAEVTDKMRDFTDGERAKLLSALQTRLFAKYAVKILLPEPTPLVLNVSADDDPSTGTAAAKVTVVAFIDYQCSTCGLFSPIAKAVAAEFGPRVRYIVRDFPLETIHENAFRSALAANAANRQGKFFEYSEMLYANQNALDDASLFGYATKLGLDLTKFKADMNDPKNAEEIRKDMADGKTYGVSGTPTLYINGVKHHGLTESKFRSAIEKALSAVK
jgi:protein-disulfide isomerase